MNKAALESTAKLLLSAHADKRAYQRRFLDDHGMPPTSIAAWQHFRAVVQALVLGSESLELDPAYLELGRVAFIDHNTKHSFLLRSAPALAIELGQQQEQQLFEVDQSDVHLLVFRFHTSGLDLSVADTWRKLGGRHLFATGPAVLVGTWPYTSDEPEPFDQGDDDGFDEIEGTGDQDKRDESA
jgi:hypothetical protein